ncbi:MAG: Alpha/beta hydrolase fold protein [Myxococcales bacterium]|nr:Alpha/beta hydrolase fold protein [Myxococcales bacterium]
MSATRRGFAPLADGGRLAYELQGRDDGGVPLLLVRPLGGSMALWGEFGRRLAAARPLIAFDPRGVGDSSDARWLESTRDMGRDTVELLDRLGIEKAHVFGLSLGGMVASWIALDAPDRVHHLVLGSTLPKPSKISRRIAHELLPLARALARPGLASELALVHEILSPQFRAAHPERVLEIEATVRAHPTGGRNLACLVLAAARHHAAKRLRAIRAPTLLLAGEWDPIVGPRAEAELLHDIPGARLELIPRSGHDFSLEQPAFAAERIIAFLGGAPSIATA